MASSHLFRIGSVKAKNPIQVALEHNKRSPKNSYGSNIDVSRINLNYSLHNDNTPDEITRHARRRIFEAGIVRLRKNAVMVVEIIFSLPISHHQRDTRPFFNDCYEWVKRTFDGELLSFDVHLDEAAPHAHALILPLIDGKMQGSKLKGNRQNLLRLNKLFSEEVAINHGLYHTTNKRLSSADLKAIKQKIYLRLKSDAAMLSTVWPCIRDAIEKDPLPFAEALSIYTPASVRVIDKPLNKILASDRNGKEINPIANYA